MRRVTRSENYELSAALTNDQFLQSPNEAQRARLLTTRLAELAQELDALDQAVKTYVPGGSVEALNDRSQDRIAAEKIMEDWQTPIMAAMAKAVSASECSVLEIGFGRGVAADFVQTHMPASHTIIECNRSVIEDFYDPWVAGYSGRDIRIVEGLWEDTLPGLERFDGILFHTYPLTADEYVERVQRSVTFAAHFFEHAANHLKPGGKFTYLTMEEDSLSRAHQRLLFQHFSGFEISQIHDLDVPEDTADAHWSQSMVLITAVAK